MRTNPPSASILFDRSRGQPSAPPPPYASGSLKILLNRVLAGPFAEGGSHE